MWRRRRRLLIVLLLILLGAGGGYWLAFRGSDPVLRTINLGAQSSNFSFDAAYSRLYVHTDLGINMVDSRQGLLQQPEFLTKVASPPAVDHRSRHLFDHDLSWTMGMLDEATGTLLRTIDLPDTNVVAYYVDSPDEQITFNYGDSATVTVVDMRTGDVLRNLNACQSSAATVASAAGGRLFVPCGDGTTRMFDLRTGRLLRTLNTAALGVANCWPLSDERTGRVILANANGLGILDGHTGRLVRTVPVQVCPVGGVEVDPRTGEILVAPYAPPPAPPARAVLVLDGRSGALLHRWAVPTYPTDLLYNPLTGHLLVTSIGPVDSAGNPLGAGTLSVLDAHSGRTLRRIGVGIMPGVLFLDTAYRHLLVLNISQQLDGNMPTRDYPEGWWPKLLRRVKGWAGWLPFSAPEPPAPPSNSTVTILDLTQL